jgi:hypothetical protein
MSLAQENASREHWPGERSFFAAVEPEPERRSANQTQDFADEEPDRWILAHIKHALNYTTKYAHTHVHAYLVFLYSRV